MTTNHTRGPWRIGKCYGAVVADVPVNAGLDNDHTEAYGGHLVAESIAVCNQPLIAAAPELWKALDQLAHGTLLDEVNHNDDSLRTIAYRSTCEYTRQALLAHAARIDAALAEAAEVQP